MDDQLTFVGHSTVLIELDGVRVMTDPLFGHLAAGSIRRLAPPVPPESLEDVAAVLISHGHLDHLDLASLRALPGRPTIVVPAGLGRAVAKVARGPVNEVRAGDQVRVGTLLIEAVHAEHGRRRSPFVSAEAALGFLVAGSTSVYFAGDTDLFPGMRELRGRVDLALLPVGGWGLTLGPGHMDPRRAAEATDWIQPAVAIPIHWGTLYPIGARRLARARFEGPGPAFRDAVASRAAHVDVRVLRPGQSTTLDGRRGS